MEKMVFEKSPFVSHSHTGLEQGEVEYGDRILIYFM